jgi:hypothetical protein
MRHCNLLGISRPCQTTRAKLSWVLSIPLGAIITLAKATWSDWSWNMVVQSQFRRPWDSYNLVRITLVRLKPNLWCRIWILAIPPSSMLLKILIQLSFNPFRSLKRLSIGRISFYVVNEWVDILIEISKLLYNWLAIDFMLLLFFFLFLFLIRSLTASFFGYLTDINFGFCCRWSIRV